MDSNCPVTRESNRYCCSVFRKSKKLAHAKCFSAQRSKPVSLAKAEKGVGAEAGSVHLICRIKNTGNGPAFRVTLWLLEYGGISGGAFDYEHYIAPLGPGERYEGPEPVEPHGDRLYRSASVSLGGAVPKKVNGENEMPFHVLLRWEAMFWTVGESYVEEHFGEDEEPRGNLFKREWARRKPRPAPAPHFKTRRPRIKRVYVWERAWRTLRGYDRKGRR